MVRKTASVYRKPLPFCISQQYRNFSRKLDLGMSKQFGQGTIGDEEFLPEREDREIEHNIKISSSLQISKRPDDMLKHNEEVGGKLYKYDLPVENEALVFINEKSLIIQEEELGNTPAMNLFEKLEVDLDTAFESFVIKHHQMYNNEIDMYGDIKQAGDSQLKVSCFSLLLVTFQKDLDEFIKFMCFNLWLTFNIV